MKKACIVPLIAAKLLLGAEDGRNVSASTDIEIEHVTDGASQKIVIERKSPLACDNVKMTPEDIFSGNLAGEHISNECKISMVTTVGGLQSATVSDGIKTVGEPEVLNFIRLMAKKPKEFLLIDARKQHWYDQMTIPGSTNIPYTELDFDPIMEKDYYANLEKMGIKHKNGVFDFGDAKKITVFCNGILCVQSKYFIEKLLKIGYPKEKIFWYRGGLQDWSSVGLTVVKNGAIHN